MQSYFDTCLEKGKIGEQIVREYLEAKGWCVYLPPGDSPHSFDMMCIKNKQKVIALDIKTKPKMRFIKNATGINSAHFDCYTKFSSQHSMPFYVVFVDEDSREIYGASLEKLELPYWDGEKHFPMLINNGKIRLWSTDVMTKIGTLQQGEAQQLQDLSQRSSIYKAQLL